MAAAAPPAVAAELVAPALVVVELMVDPAHRRRGLARTLLRGFTAGAPRAWLATHPDGDAVKLYETEGWRPGLRYQVGDQPVVLYLWSRGSLPQDANSQYFATTMSA